MTGRVFAKLLAAFLTLSAIILAALVVLPGATSAGNILFPASAAALASVGLAAWLARGISDRLARIQQAAERLADGELEMRIGDQGTDEIGRLAGALDRAAEALSAQLSALEGGRRQLEALLDSLPDPVLALAADRRILWANAAMRRLVPVIREGAPLVEVIRDPGVINVLNDAVELRSPRRIRSFIIAPGRVLVVSATPLAGGGAVAVLHDVTEMERIEKARRDFIANVSHELRTPLTSIQGYAETLLEMEGSSASAQEFLEVIRRNADRMARLTEDLLVLARVESGEERFQMRRLHPSELLQPALENFTALAQARGSRLNVEDGAQQQVLADPEAIYHVFSNFLDNAIKYCSPSSAITIGSRDVEGMVEFWVRDNGPGIASEHLPRIFERFYRVDKARSKETGGTGLGLAIAKHIVMAHHGEIWAESELHHGSTFFFRLPAAPRSA